MTVSESPQTNLQSYSHFPAFFSIKQFADLVGASESHIQHAARNFVEPGMSTNRAKLAEGWRAIKWGKVYIIYHDQDHQAMMMLFGSGS